jgi:hypothetical protein
VLAGSVGIRAEGRADGRVCRGIEGIIEWKKREERREETGDDASWRTSAFTTACDQKSSWPTHHLLLKFTLSFACGSLGIMLATATTNTLTSTSRWSFSFFNTRIEFRSMFIATLFLFLFLCLGQYSYFLPNTMPHFLPFPFAPPRSAKVA